MTSPKRNWLIRYPDYSFSRPLTEEELMKIFSEGNMQPQNEISSAYGYWFALQDVKEMRKHFGNIPMDGLFKKVKEEITHDRYVITAPMKTLILNSPPVHQAVNVESAEEEPIQTISPLMKVMLAILTLLVFVLLFVWFG